MIVSDCDKLSAPGLKCGAARDELSTRHAIDEHDFDHGKSDAFLRLLAISRVPSL